MGCFVLGMRIVVLEIQVLVILILTYTRGVMHGRHVTLAMVAASQA